MNIEAASCSETKVPIYRYTWDPIRNNTAN